ncbi:2-hydroxyacid dehydrogenase [Winogradskyella tangerina]|uniref:2-hydroxyacid dehydrogenase n=1 Tax=Winogradskyella tangerina TaxID=2023240 RepID=UPI000DBE593C|nr:2-hydroxyacid dehydrogenase [Winogradskyella tangerina]
MKVLVYSTRGFERPYIDAANNSKHELSFISDSLSSATAIKAVGYDAISIFSSDEACFLTLEKLRSFGVKYISLRSVGYDNVNIKAAKREGIKVANVPAYSPYAIAEHAVALLLALNRKLIEANANIKRFNFDLNYLTGFDLNGKTVGIVGTGRIGSVMTKIMNGFGCTLLGYDVQEDNLLEERYGLQYVPLETLCENSDIISLHVPLNSDTHYMINEDLLDKMKPSCYLINTARGAVVNTEDLIKALESKSIAAYGMDVYENEKGLFFKDLSREIPEDDMLLKLIAMPNVLVTGHQAFLTTEALKNIAETTIYNLDCWEKGTTSDNEIIT